MRHHARRHFAAPMLADATVAMPLVCRRRAERPSDRCDADALLPQPFLMALMPIFFVFDYFSPSFDVAAFDAPDTR